MSSPTINYSLTPPAWCRDITPTSLVVNCQLLPVASPTKNTASLQLRFYNDRILEQSNVVCISLVNAASEDSSSSSSSTSSSSSSVATTASTSSSSTLPSFFVKRACVKWLAQRINRSTEKWAISAKSFANEQYFNAKAPCRTMIQFGCGIPFCYFSDTLPYYDENGSSRSSNASLSSTMDSTTTHPLSSSTMECSLSPLESVYTTICEQLPFEKYTEYRHFDYDQTLSVLQWCAKLHALFHIDIPSSSSSESSLSYTKQLQNGLFSAGGWWRKELRPSVKYGTLYHVFEQHCKDLPSYKRTEKYALDTVENHEFVRNLSHDNYIQEIHNSSVHDHPIRTIVHGDLKPSNIFFTKDKPQPIVKVIDWQWTGGASTGAVDLAYLFAGGIRYDTLNPMSVEREKEFLDYYYKEYRQTLQSLTSDPKILNYSREQLQNEYERELVIYWTTAMPYLLNDLTLSVCQENAQKYGWLTHEEDDRMTAWLTWRAITILRTKRTVLFPRLTIPTV